MTVLPAGHDPASSLRQREFGGLRGFVRKGCLDRTDGEVKPAPAGDLLAPQTMTALNAPGTGAFSVLPNLIKAISAQARLVLGDAAGRTLPDCGVGTESGLSKQIVTAIRTHRKALNAASGVGIEGGRCGDRAREIGD
jgi:hypothetical protein